MAILVFFILIIIITIIIYVVIIILWVSIRSVAMQNLENVSSKMAVLRLFWVYIIILKIIVIVILQSSFISITMQNLKVVVKFGRVMAILSFHHHYHYHHLIGIIQIYYHAKSGDCCFKLAKLWPFIQIQSKYVQQQYMYGSSISIIWSCLPLKNRVCIS